MLERSWQQFITAVRNSMASPRAAEFRAEVDRTPRSRPRRRRGEGSVQGGRQRLRWQEFVSLLRRPPNPGRDA